ncbi:hypothetical protein FKP32DRAFT_197561 [Trametes sanguinea]|nr:hypothetical protein FKP32DRAFT_197561 [Trametes sanguinea]
MGALFCVLSSLERLRCAPPCLDNKNETPVACSPWRPPLVIAISTASRGRSESLKDHKPHETHIRSPSSDGPSYVNYRQGSCPALFARGINFRLRGLVPISRSHALLSCLPALHDVPTGMAERQQYATWKSLAYTDMRRQ